MTGRNADWSGFNPQKETFCVEIMKGASIQDAYRTATGKPVERGSYQAYRWLNEDPYIVQRLNELRDKMKTNNEITLQGHLEKLAELRDDAHAAGKFGPAIAAEVARGKAAGLYVEKKEISVNDPSTMNRDQLMKRLREIESHKSKLVELSRIPDEPMPQPTASYGLLGNGVVTDIDFVGSEDEE